MQRRIRRWPGIQPIAFGTRSTQFSNETESLKNRVSTSLSRAGCAAYPLKRIVLLLCQFD